MPVRTELTHQQEWGEHVLFEETESFFSPSDDGRFDVCTIKSAIGQLLQMSLVDDDAGTRLYRIPPFADMYSRGLADIDDASHDAWDHQQLIKNLNTLEATIGDPENSARLITELADLAFVGVLMRPKGLVLPASDRQLHKNELVYGRSDSWFADSFRYRLNALHRLKAKTELGRRASARLSFLDAESDGIVTFDTIERFVSSDEAADQQHRDNIRALAGVFAGRHINSLLPLLTADPEQAEVLRGRFIERSYSLLDGLEETSLIGRDLFHIDIEPDAAEHILSGDQNGGGHHLERLNPKYFRVVGEPEMVQGGVRGSEQLVPAVRVQRLDDGKVVSDDVRTFFPIEWSAEEVLGRISDPQRVVLERENNRGRIEQSVHASGILVMRVIHQHEESDEQYLITAYPSIFVPPEVERRLRAA